jgi:hypothetical protein
MLLQSCGSEQIAPGALDPNDGIVFTGDHAMALAKQCSRNPPAPIEGTWTPSETQIRKLEEELPSAIVEQASAEQRSGRVPDPHEYQRQYGGLIVGGKQIIYINGFVDSPSTNWWFRPVVVCDGGYLFFGAEYDPEKNTFSDFQFHGH